MSFEEEWKPAYPIVRDYLETDFVTVQDSYVSCAEVESGWWDYEAQHVPEEQHLTEEALDWYLQSLGYRHGFDPKTKAWSWEGLRRRQA